MDNYHGTIVPDPYRYMENPDDPETKEFVQANNVLYEQFIDKNLLEKYRTTFRKYITYPSYSLPFKQSDAYYYIKHEGDDPQGKFFSKKATSNVVTELFDFNTLSHDGTTTPLVIKLSPNGKFLATVVSKHGSDWHHLLIINVDDKSIIESIPWVSFTHVEWLSDDSGFYYTRYPDQTDLPLEKQRKEEKLFLHKIGSNVSEDTLIYDPQDGEYGANFTVSSDNQWLCISSNKSTMPENRLLLKNITSDDPLITIIPELDGNLYRIVDIVDNDVYCMTSWNAPNKRLMKFSLEHPQRDSWSELIPESSFVLEAVFIVNSQLLLVYIENVKNELHLYSLDGEKQIKVTLPAIGSFTKNNDRLPTIGGKKDDKELLFCFENFFTPPTIYRYDFSTNTITEFLGVTLPINKDQYIIKQVFYTSKDGTNIPMFILHNKNLLLDGNNKTILYGYGGYNNSLYPWYIPRFLSWLATGKDHVYAIANLRGGGEYGKKWHFQGILGNKQNVFDDFIAAAEWLITNKYTNSKNLAINGRSNGGLLVGACVIQRPDLFGIAVPEVGVMDMLRFKHYQAGRYWTAEYGDAEKNEEHFNFLIKFSPVHNVEKNSYYPPTLAITAEADDRVVPMHTKKFTAAMQYAQKANNPILMRVETKVGHGYGKSIPQQIDDNAFVFAFIDQVFGIIDKT